MVLIDLEGWGQMLQDTSSSLENSSQGPNHCGEDFSDRRNLHSQEKSDFQLQLPFSGRGNTEQMATIVTRFTLISTVRGHLFFGINSPWSCEVFIEVLALGGEACQQVNGIRDMTEAQASEYFT